MTADQLFKTALAMVFAFACVASMYMASKAEFKKQKGPLVMYNIAYTASVTLGALALLAADSEHWMIAIYLLIISALPPLAATKGRNKAREEQDS